LIVRAKKKSELFVRVSSNLSNRNQISSAIQLPFNEDDILKQPLNHQIRSRLFCNSGAVVPSNSKNRIRFFAP